MLIIVRLLCYHRNKNNLCSNKFSSRTIVACMSPVVTVSCMLTLAEQGYGEDKGFASLLCTAASIDVIHIASLFSICFSFVFSNGI